MKIIYVKHYIIYGLLASTFLILPHVLQGQQKDTIDLGNKKKDTIDLGYRKISAADFNGSAYTISMDDIKRLPVTNISNLLSGRAPGFYSIQTSGGTVNEAADYWLRGRRTNAEGVLVLVDGQEREFGVLSPYEVKSVTVLKDASVAALYGTRAANGIILVTTRKGKKGPPTIEFTTQVINQKPIGLPKSLKAHDYALAYNEAIKDDGLDASKMYSQYDLQQYRNRNGVNTESYPDIDWMGDYFKKSSWVQRYNLSISGGSDRTRYFMNAGMLKQDGMFVLDNGSANTSNNATSRYNIRSNLEVDVTPSTLLNLDLYGWYDRQNRPGGDSYAAYSALLKTPPNAFPPYYFDAGQYTDQDGNIVKGINGKITAGNDLMSNPWALLNRNGYSILNRVYGSFRSRLSQNLSFITKGLTASAQLSMDSYTAAVTDREKGFAYYNLTDANSTVLKRTNTDQKMNNDVTNKSSISRVSMDMQMAYQRKFNKHNIYATLFYNQYESDNQTSIPSRFQTIGSWVGYNYDHKYYVDLTGSYHGVYKFAPGKRFGFFPVVSLGWTATNEKFLESIKEILPYFKLRASYGLIGNQRGVSEFRYKSRLLKVNNVYYFGNTMKSVSGYEEDILANPDLTWEKARQLNIGVDLQLFSNKLTYTFDYFHDSRYDMYMANENVTSLLGTVANIDQNIGEMYSHGYEMAISWRSKIGDWNYNLGATYSFWADKTTKSGQIRQPYKWLEDEGYEMGLRRGYMASGLFQSYEEIAASPKQTFSEVSPGDIKYKDINGDGIIDENDKVPLGYGNVPSIFYGVNLGISYKNIGLTVLLQGATHTTRMLNGNIAFPFTNDGTIYEHQRDYWTPENPGASLPNISTLTSSVNNVQPSSFWMVDAGYLRLKTVEIFYEFPDKLLKKSLVKHLTIFANGYNMHVWPAGRSPLDPEDTGSSSAMPLTRNMSIGASIRF